MNLSGWAYNESLTTHYQSQLMNQVSVKNTNMTFGVYVKTDLGKAEQPSNRTIRVYARPYITPFPTNAAPSLVLDGWLDPENELQLYHQE